MNEFELSMGASVYGQGEKCGRVAKVVVDPDVRRVTHIIVQDGLLKKSAHIVPFDAIETAARDRVDLKLDRDGVGNCSQYRQVTVAHTVQAQEGGMPMSTDSFSGHAAVPATRVHEKVHEGISPRLRVLERNAPVVSVDGNIGPLEHLLVSSSSGEITRLVARHGTLRLSHPVIPAERIQSFDDDRIFVNLLNEDLSSLPDYSEMPGMKQQKISDGDPDAEPAVVARAPEREETATSLSRRIETVLAGDPRTKDAVIDVIDEGGLITLAGEVNSGQTRTAVAELVSKQPGVVSVVNNLRVR
jgi:uncharacterized protein YrrD